MSQQSSLEKMSDSTPDTRPGKRKNLTPEAQQEKEKCIKQYESLNTHPSVLNLHTSPLGIAKKCEIAGISEALPKIDVETVYKLVIDLSNRVSTLENQVAEKDQEVFQLRRDNATLEKSLNDIRLERSKNKEDGEEEEDSKFLAVMKKEVPALSDHVAKNENLINQLRGEVDKLKEDKAREESMDDGEIQNPTNTEFQELITTQKQVRDTFEKESRRSHLEREQHNQYTMRETIRVTGIPFKPGENTNDLICRVAHSIGVQISHQDISVSHRTGRRFPGRPRAIICKFTRRDTKYAILRNKKLAKNITQDDDGNPVRIFIDEKLTPMRANVCKLLREKKIQHHTHDGKIFIHKENSTEFTVLDTPEDWLKWDQNDKTKIDLGVFPKL